MAQGRTARKQTQVLIVGGGVVGLSAALFLRAHAVDCLLVERHPGTSIHPRAWGWYQRTLELFRSVDVEREVLDAAAGYAGHRLNAKVESLTGRVISATTLPSTEDLDEITPCRQVSLGQDRLESVLRRAAQARGATVEFHTELVSLRQDGHGVDATVLDRDSGETHDVRAGYVIAADGARGGVRDGLGIGRHGRGTLRHQVSILFRADLTEPLAGRRFSICQIENPEVSGVLGHDDTLQQGTLILTYDPAAGESAADFTPDRCTRLVRAAVGVPDLDVTIRDVLPWELAALVADRFRSGRVFLAGDAAHVVPPIGGYGANTGIHDAHNLAWKLAAVLRGQAGSELLDSYDAERRPVAASTVEQASLRLAARAGFASPEQRRALRDPLAVTLGYSYEPAGNGSANGHARTTFRDPDALRGEPGTRAPHLPVIVNGARRSILDLFGPGFVLMTSSAGREWQDAANDVALRLGVCLRVRRIGSDVLDPLNRWRARYGITEGGAVLVRPDGFVGWRAPAADATSVTSLGAAVRSALGRGRED